jgi:hypothetical protein
MTRPDLSTIRRWHCHPQAILRNSDDNVLRHSRAVQALAVGLCANIGYPIYDGRSRLPEWCMRHDEPEIWFGDWPASICRDPRVAALKAELEADYWQSAGYTPPALNRVESLVFQISDKMEAYIFARDIGADMDAGGFPNDVVRAMRWAVDLDTAVKAMTKGQPRAVEWLEMRLTRPSVVPA